MMLEAISFGSCKAYLLCVDEREREREVIKKGQTCLELQWVLFLELIIVSCKNLHIDKALDVRLILCVFRSLFCILHSPNVCSTNKRWEIWTLVLLIKNTMRYQKVTELLKFWTFSSGWKLKNKNANYKKIDLYLNLYRLSWIFKLTSYNIILLSKIDHIE